ncbi:hypothetical protein QWZ03_16115 [Chitinimonas viridis]|uniref:Uncharacterized protein n=1 Tax=Chitinimonas viridis TaxID=664880 RepID=A0ABT8B9X9_9NEIS|nr:hypothetical protein [Chitinimonas viridis]MDN3578294.1 hypothetical protein [Chitinimonas viridis]
MAITLSTRKPIDTLGPEDLQAFPIWEFAEDEEGADEQDETWVRPLNAASIPLARYALSAAATFQTVSGQIIKGFIGISTDEEIDISHGILLHEGKYLYIPPKQDRQDRRRFLEALQLKEAQVFPVTFTLHVRVAGESGLRQGEIR